MKKKIFIFTALTDSILVTADFSRKSSDFFGGFKSLNNKTQVFYILENPDSETFLAFLQNDPNAGAVVVAQLVERLFPTPDIRGSILVIGIFFYQV